MAKFRKKPVVIDAWKWDGTVKTFDELKAAGLIHSRICKMESDGTAWGLRIDTLEGVMDADEGDWIIKGVAGEFYPCKHAIFEKTYEPELVIRAM